MAPNPNQNKITNRLAKAVKQTQPRRKQHIAHDSDSESEIEVEWGDTLEASSAAAPSTRRVTRHSGMTNKQLYRSVIVNGVTYRLGQTVKVRSFSDDPYLATIYKMWENEKGEKQIVARWLLRKSEMYGKSKQNEIAAEPDEVFYSNADDLIAPDMLIGPLTVLSLTEYEKTQQKSTTSSSKKAHSNEANSLYFCRRYFNEHTAFLGQLDWDTFYYGGRIVDPAVDQAMFKKEEKPKSRPTSEPARARATAQARRAAKQSSTAAKATPARSTSRGSKKRKVDVSDDEDADPNTAPSSDDEEDAEMEDADFATSKRRARKAAATPRTPARTRKAALAKSGAAASTPPATGRRRLRLQDVQTAAVSASIAKRAARIGNGSFRPVCEGATMYEIARQRLHVSAVPDTLPCREEEFAEIYGHLYSTIEERNSMCMYISGVPGTGKTATVHEVIRTLQENAEEGELPDFQFIELNGMKMTEPAQTYTQLWQAITGNKATPKHAAQLLEKHFSTPSPRRHTYVVLMDELDLLVTKSQSIMYNFFDWPHRPHAKLIVVAIANTMDLPERMLHHKVSSRLGLTRINFQPYTHQQLMTIVQSRLEGCEAFDPDAVELCARKISAVSGDARRALDVCRRAVEMVEADWQRTSAQPGGKRSRQSLDGSRNLVTMMIIDRAVKEMYASGYISFIQNASLQQKIFLVALRAAIRKAGIPEVSLGDAAFIHRQLCQLHELTVPTYEQISKICAQLGASRCILAESSMLDVHQQVRLGVAEDDITVALRPDPLFQKIVSG
ncbi:Origin recognition complex, subunit 1 [Dipsacomyces acuminosporus]|nr:Origin recognition complex, subunit 1 [Dipsacomyces acuminosporus]